MPVVSDQIILNSRVKPSSATPGQSVSHQHTEHTDRPEQL